MMYGESVYAKYVESIEMIDTTPIVCWKTPRDRLHALPINVQQALSKLKMRLNQTYQKQNSCEHYVV